MHLKSRFGQVLTLHMISRTEDGLEPSGLVLLVLQPARGVIRLHVTFHHLVAVGGVGEAAIFVARASHEFPVTALNLEANDAS